MKIAFVWYWDRASEIFPNWHDGLTGALGVIRKYGHTVDIFMDKKIPDDSYDCILFWDDSNSGFFSHLDKYKAKKGMILTTLPHNIDNLKMLDVVFCESKQVYDAVRQHGIRALRAFGTDTELYTPDKKTKKDIKYFYPATFSPWKRQSEIAHHAKDLVCVGTIQPDGQDEYKACVDAGVEIKLGYFKAEKIRDLYRRAEHVLIPAIHGSERTVLESMSMGIVPTVNPKNERASSYVKEFLESDLPSPREFVKRFYSHILYADKILGGFA